MYSLPHILIHLAAQTFNHAFAATNYREHYGDGLHVMYPPYHAPIPLHSRWQLLGSSVHTIAASVIVEVEFVSVIMEATIGRCHLHH